MNLFINAVSSSGALILFDKNRNIIVQDDIEVKWNESSQLPETIDNFLSKHQQSYSNIDHIVVVHWPGSFTGVRAICLLVNTIAFSTNSVLTELSYFDLFHEYPIAKQSSKRDMFIALLSHSDNSPLVRETHDIKIMSNEDIIKYLKENNISKIYGEAPLWWDGEIVEKIDYSYIIRNIELKNNSQIQPLYIKKPNIC